MVNPQCSILLLSFRTSTEEMWPVFSESVEFDSGENPITIETHSVIDDFNAMMGTRNFDVEGF